MNRNQIVKELIEVLSAVSDLTVTPSSVSRMRRVFQLGSDCSRDGRRRLEKRKRASNTLVAGG